MNSWSPTKARFWVWFRGINTCFWIVMIPISLMTELKDSVPYLVTISLLALVFSEAGGWQTARLDQKQEESEQ